jgi:hypothetical protein
MNYDSFNSNLSQAVFLSIIIYSLEFLQSKHTDFFSILQTFNYSNFEFSLVNSKWHPLHIQYYAININSFLINNIVSHLVNRFSWLLILNILTLTSSIAFYFCFNCSSLILLTIWFNLVTPPVELTSCCFMRFKFQVMQ